MSEAELAYRRDEAARRYRSTRRTADVCASIGLISAVSIIGLLWAPFFLLGAAAAAAMARQQRSRLDALLAA